MTDLPLPRVGHAPDADLIGYISISVPSLDGLPGIVASVSELVRMDRIRLIDLALLHRRGRAPAVTTPALPDIGPLTELVAESPVRLSDHDIGLIAATVAPGSASLVLLVEARWASPMAAAVREAGGCLSGGERVAADLFLDRMRQSEGDDPAGVEPRDLLVRGPSLGVPSELAVDPVAQVRALAAMVARGILSEEQYEAQRRRIVDA